MNEISNQDDGPRPVLPWEIPSEEALAEWKETVRRREAEAGEGREAFTMEWTLCSALGMFLFSAYLKDKCNDHVRINFAEEVSRWRNLRGRQRAQKARNIVSLYIATRERELDEETGEPKLPPKTEIDETELERHTTLHLSEEEMQQLFEQNSDPSCSKCCVGLDGPVRDEIITAVSQYRSTRANNPTSTSEDSQGQSSATVASKENSSSRGNGAVALDGKSPNEPSNINEMSNSDGKEKASVSPSSGGRAPKVQPVFQNDLFDKAEAVVMESLKRQYWESFEQSEEYTKLLNFLWFQDRKVVEEDFFVMRVLGRGGFGLVTACKKGTSGKLYAMKVMNKKRIKIKKSEQLTLNERQALAAVDSPFVVNLKYSFQSKDDIFLILDLMTGGDLSFHLSQTGKFTRKQCLYYAARIMLGLQALHDQQYVYRDLKPENCLLAEDGRVKITDLGLATKITPTLHGAAGTRGYWAPEMLRRDKKGKRMPYGHTVDWFSFGCVLAEFISGTNPFRSEMALNFGLEKGKKTKEKAIDCATLEMDPKFDPKKYDSDAADLCRQLLEKDERKRLGHNGCEEIMAHPWFNEINWENIITDRKRPPFIPPKDVNAASQSEIGTFAEDKTFHETVLEERDEEVYKDWDWTNPRAFAAEVIEFLIYERVTGVPLLPIQPPSSCCCVIS